jgi:tetrapyrrole methylase family protein / MazG family protein
VSESKQIIAADELLRRIQGAPFSGPMLDVAADRDLLVFGVAEANLESFVALLRRIYPEGHVIEVTPEAGGVVSLRVDAISRDENWRSAQRLHSIIAYLRSPEGCPWDRAQDWSSLAPKVVEEAYEVVDAIADGDPSELAGELGDLLLIVALLTQIGEELEAFTIEDVYEIVNRKLIRRHPHVFGDDAADSPEAVLTTWQRIKREEQGATERPRSKYDRLPRSMPGIAKAAAMLQDAPQAPRNRELPSGEELLAIIEGMLGAGRDPDAELRAELDRKYSSD